MTCLKHYILSKASLCCLRPGTHWRQSRIRHIDFVEFLKVDRMSKGHSTFWQQKSTTFDKVNSVEHFQLWQHCRPQPAVEFDFVTSLYGRATKSKRLTGCRTSWRQSTVNKTATKAWLSPKWPKSNLTLTTFGFLDHVEFDFVASVYRPYNNASIHWPWNTGELWQGCFACQPLKSRILLPVVYPGFFSVPGGKEAQRDDAQSLASRDWFLGEGQRTPHPPTSVYGSFSCILVRLAVWQLKWWSLISSMEEL